jgi:hypothetical protein
MPQVSPQAVAVGPLLIPFRTCSALLRRIYFTGTPEFIWESVAIVVGGLDMLAIVKGAARRGFALLFPHEFKRRSELEYWKGRYVEGRDDQAVHDNHPVRAYMTAARSPPRSEPQNSQDFRPKAINRLFCPCRAGIGSSLPMASVCCVDARHNHSWPEARSPASPHGERGPCSHSAIDPCDGNDGDGSVATAPSTDKPPFFGQLILSYLSYTQLRSPTCTGSPSKVIVERGNKYKPY